LFFPLPGLNKRDAQRVEYTFNEILKMNETDREMLREARKNAYNNFKDMFYSYIKRKEEGASKDRLDRIVMRIRKENHCTVWREMQRWHLIKRLSTFDTELDEYFIHNPEALNW
jgi:hypothetical protein